MFAEANIEEKNSRSNIQIDIFNMSSFEGESGTNITKLNEGLAMVDKNCQ